jgi:hypothetical protein
LNLVDIFTKKRFWDYLSKLSATSRVSNVVAAGTMIRMVPTMGIRQIGAPLSQTGGLKLSDEVFELAGSRAPPRAPERQRGLWSFLTWSFVIAPIVTAETFFAKNASALGQAAEEQNNSVGGLDKGSAEATTDHNPSAVAAVVADDSRDDDAGASRLIGAARTVLHDGGSQHDQSPAHVASHETDAASAPALGGGGGGGGGGPHDAVASEAGASSYSAVSFQDGDLTNETLGGLAGQSLSSGEIPYGLPNGLAVDASASGGLIDISVGGEPILASTTHDLISAATTTVSEILSPVGLDTAVNLKDILGFDVQLSGTHGFLANDLGAALEANLPQPVANLMSTAVGATPESLSLLDFGASKTLDNLLGPNDLFDVGHLNSVTVLTSGQVTASGMTGNLSGDGDAALEKLTGALATGPDSASDANLPVDLGSDVPRVGVVVGEATDVTPGHSIDFPSQALPEGDVLFGGSGYTDYHVALNTSVSSSSVNGVTATATAVTNTHDAASLSLVDAPNASHASEPPAPEHQEVLLPQVSNAVDELSVRGHGH